ncbi:MAG: hypothetical protein ACXACY_23600 [Candidatus Hodarchaeales archaeon]|jgi:hypothetical protein
MKIYYKPHCWVGKFDIPTKEPDNPIFLRDLNEGSVNYLMEAIYYIRSGGVLDLLLPEQIWILCCHATYIPSFSCISRRDEFIVRMRQEIKQLSKQEIEPGMFKNEDTL